MKNRIALLIVMFVVVTGCLTACNESEDLGPQGINDALLIDKNPIEENETLNKDGIIQIRAVITGIDTTRKNVKIKTVINSKGEYNFEQKEYSLGYSGATDVKDAFGAVIAVGQLDIGDIVDVSYNSKTDRLDKLVVSKDTFCIRKVTGMEIDEVAGTIKFGKSIYQYSGSTIVTDNGKQVSVKDIDVNDMITLRGEGTRLYSITIDKGHGFIKLSGYTQFLDGYIEIGDQKVLKVTKDMVIPVTEGTYKVVISKGDVIALRNITVARNKTVLAEFEEYLQAPNKQGTVKFALTPSDAKLYIDGKKVDHTKSVELEYGAHTMTIVAKGYDNYIETFIVDEIYQKLEINLGDDKEDEKSDSGEEESESESQSEKESESEKETESETQKKTEEQSSSDKS